MKTILWLLRAIASFFKLRHMTHSARSGHNFATNFHYGLQAYFLWNLSSTDLKQRISEYIVKLMFPAFRWIWLHEDAHLRTDRFQRWRAYIP